MYFLQILDNSGSLANSLSSQDLFHLLQSPQQPQAQQPLLESYGVRLVQQPHLQQHFHQQASLFPPATFLKQEEPVQDNLAVFKTEFNPDYQTFNYEEQYQGSSHQQGNYRGAYPEQEESENSPSITVVRKSPESTVTSFQDQLENQNIYEPKSNSVNEEETYYDNTATNPENENNPEDYEENHNNSNQNEAESSTSYGGSGALVTSYYTTLPNREAAETLATLAAAGNVNSNVINHIRNGEQENVTPNRGDAPVEEDYVEEEDEEEESEHPFPQTSKPVNIQRPKETKVQEATRFSSEHRETRPGVHPAHHQDQIQEDTDYVDYSVDVDEQGPEHEQETIGNTESGKKEQNKGNNTKSTNTNLQFGARIRPKRNK
jgi:hypothetical protein